MTGVIEIKDIGNVDAGRWECVSRNSVGFASDSFSLTVIGMQSILSSDVDRFCTVYMLRTLYFIYLFIKV